MIDTHCHLTSESLATNVSAVVDHAIADGITRMITVGTDARDSQASGVLADQFDTVYFSAGIHPHEAAKASPTDIETLSQLWKQNKCVAVGEIGLDYHYDFSPRDVQRDLLARQLEAAADTGLPLIVHSREAFDDTVAILKQQGCANRPAVFHCFTGTPDEAAVIAANGWRVSFTGVVTFKKLAALQSIAAAYPADQLMVETDAPYMSPEPVRHIRPNEPAMLKHTVAFLAKLRGQSFESVAAQTAENAKQFFNL